jgi:succinate dehydrogenase / fumarate reductase flavoprotein subunit
VVEAADADLDSLIHSGDELARAAQRQVRDLMWDHCGVVRDEGELTHGLEILDGIRAQAPRIDVRPNDEGWSDLVLALDVRAMLDTAEATIRCALERRETRGAHNRSDHPDLDEALTVNFYVRRNPGGGEMEITSEPVPPVPDELKTWAYSGEDHHAAGKLLE